MRTAKARQYAKSRTINIAALIACLGAVQLMLPEVRAQIPADLYPWLLMGIGVIMAYMRAVTEKPLSEK